MSDWQDKSDFEINKAVSDIVDHQEMVVYLNEDQQLVYLCESFGQFDINPVCNFNPCNNPSDAWPIMVKNDITTVNLINEYIAVHGLQFSDNEHSDSIADWVFEARDKNPLRAAMIVYLEMNGVKPNE